MDTTQYLLHLAEDSGGGGGGTKRRGRVRVDGRHLVDDDGPFNARICTLFYAPWAMRDDRPRLDRAFSTLQAAGYHGYRALNGVEGQSWADRMIDPKDVETVVKMIDYGYDQYGLRCWLVAFADGPLDAVERERVTDAYAEALKGREHKILVFEFVNEISKGRKIPFDEARKLTERLRSKLGVIVIPSAPGDDEHAEELYDGLGCPCANVHTKRDIEGDGGRFEPEWAVFELPQWVPQVDAYLNGEPIGPWSSVNAEFDPLRLALAYAGTAIEGGALYCFHPGPGIRGGGAHDIARGIPAYLDETPEWHRINAAFQAIERALPGDVASWTQHNGHWVSNPLDFVLGQPHNGPFEDGRLFRVCTAEKDGEFWSVVLRVNGQIHVGVRGAMRVDVYDPLTMAVLETHDKRNGEQFTLTSRPPIGWNWDGDGFILHGRPA